MSFATRFHGTADPEPGAPVANRDVTDPHSLQLLFPELPDLDALAASLRSYHHDLRDARVELLDLAAEPGEAAAFRPAAGEPPAAVGLLGWGKHVVKLVAVDGPMPAEAVDACLGPAPFDPGRKDDARRHRAHVLLYYAGYDLDPLEPYVALGAAAGALARFGALAVLNEDARAAVPGDFLVPEDDSEDMLALLRDLPVPLLYGGFVKVELIGEDGVWMRTFACHRLRLPDLAYRAGGHGEGQRVFHWFANMLAYLRETGKDFAPGDTMRLGERDFLRFRRPRPDEDFLTSPGELLVAEAIPPQEMNLTFG